MRLVRLLPLLALGVLGALGVPRIGSSSGAARVGGRPPGLVVAGNQLKNTNGAPIHLVGVNRAGTEYACAQGWGIFDGPVTATTIAAMKHWGINTVRVPLNEDCWLGINVSPRYSGAVYRHTIGSYVRQLNDAGLYVVLDLHWGAPGTARALGQEAMPDTHAITFWHSVGRSFRANHDVLFDLFNEPHSVSWSCWQSGCAMPGGWRAVGMQTLIDTVRATGNTDPVIAEGLEWGNDLTGWSTHQLVDADRALLAGFHVYPKNSCNTASCWTKELLPVEKTVPLATTEVGEQDCSGAFVQGYLAWAEAHDTSALAWTWNTNEGCHALITNYDTGAPTTYGSRVETSIAHFVQAANATLTQSASHHQPRPLGGTPKRPGSHHKAPGSGAPLRHRART